VTYFMASTDSLEDNTAFAEKNEASFPILADEDGSMSEAYGVLGSSGLANRVTFYIDPEGRIVKIDRSVNVRTAGEQLVENLEELDAPRV
jgi:peroxiredoxin Q/BCP